MYTTLLTLHSMLRWIVLVLLLYSIYRSYRGYAGNRSFTKMDNALRHWTATGGHIQLIFGVLIYLKSPLVTAYRKHKEDEPLPFDYTFFSILHLLLMFTAIVILTIGSAKAKRELENKKKFSTMLIWFVVALLIILIAIPWPFSPLVKRPYIRMF